MGSEFSLLLLLSIRYAHPFTWLGTSLTLIRSPPLLIGGRPPPLSLISPSPFLAYFRSAPAASSPLLPLLSLSTARPTPLRSPVVFPPAWWPRSATLLLAVSRFPQPPPPSSDFPPTHGSPPPTHPSASTSSGSASSSSFHMAPGWVWVSGLLLGLPLPRLTPLLCVCCSRSLSRSRLRVASLSPAYPL